MTDKPIIGVTMGDPAGVGPEIVARAVASPEVRETARVVVFGTASLMERALALVSAGIDVNRVSRVSESSFSSRAVDVLDVAPAAGSVKPGVIQGSAGQAAFEYVSRAISSCLAGEIDAIATAPINKESLRAGAVPYLDHTEMLGKLTDSPDPMTLFVLDKMRIFFLTRHVPLEEACRLITHDRVLEGLKRANESMRDLGVPAPRIAVAGLNPHAGDGGLFGTQDDHEIAPAVARARELGVDAYGPIAADSVFFQNRNGRFDAVLSLYHDQGHIAAKTVDFERTISVTLGIPFLRTSVDHGTAFDIAWKGLASAVGMAEAIKVAAAYAPLFSPK
ncbi:MAG TPA: 4-hydroxythreonine-4-phosphate dehydrogenase PdxA [Chloroflexota bacterium]